MRAKEGDADAAFADDEIHPDDEVRGSVAGGVWGNNFKFGVVEIRFNKKVGVVKRTSPTNPPTVPNLPRKPQPTQGFGAEVDPVTKGMDALSDGVAVTAMGHLVANPLWNKKSAGSVEEKVGKTGDHRLTKIN